MRYSFLPKISGKLLAEKPVFLRIIVHSVYTAYEIPVTLLQTMQHHMRRYLLIRHIYIGKNTSFPDHRVVMYIAYFRIDPFAGFGSGINDRVVSCGSDPRAVYDIAPAELLILIDSPVHKTEYLLCGSEMDKLRWRKPEKLQPELTERIPYSLPAFRQLITVVTLRLLLIELPQSRINGKWVLKIPVQGQSYPVIHKSAVFLSVKASIRTYKTIKRIKHIHTEYQRSCIDIHGSGIIYGTYRLQGLLALLVMEGFHISVLTPKEYPVILPGFHRFLEAYCSRSVSRVIYKQRIKQKQYVTGQ